jgi:hypothetical protein
MGRDFEVRKHLLMTLSAAALLVGAAASAQAPQAT